MVGQQPDQGHMSVRRFRHCAQKLRVICVWPVIRRSGRPAQKTGDHSGSRPADGAVFTRPGCKNNEIMRRAGSGQSRGGRISKIGRMWGGRAYGAGL